MKILFRSVGAAGIVLFINIITWFVVSENQSRGLYSYEADSIGIPIIETGILSIFALGMYLLILYVEGRVLVRQNLENKGIFLIGVVGALALYFLDILSGIYGVVYWTYPNHYKIAAIYFIALIFLVVDLVRWWLRLRGQKREVKDGKSK